MPALMKKHPIEKVAKVTWHGAHYALPLEVIEQYKIPNNENEDLSVEDVFCDLISEYGEPGVLLRGLRNREGLSQLEFAKILNITQTNLSAMENGRRNIGKEFAKRLAIEFKVDYRIFL